MKHGMLLGLCILLGAVGTAAAADTPRMTAGAVKKTAEASMVVTGSVEVNPDGSLHDYVLDKPEKLPGPVVTLVDQVMKQWQFKLSGSAKQIVKSSVSIRVVASPDAQGNYAVRVQGASFGDDSGSDASSISYASTNRQPMYPVAAIQARVSGTVFVAVRVGRDGSVEDVVAEQVNLDQYADSRDMERFRKTLADASIKAIQGWKFHVPTQGPKADAPYWVGRIPVNYSLSRDGAKPQPYGRWETYIPGPRQSPAWMSKSMANESPDAVAGDGLHSGNDNLQLLTPLSGA